jgi:hypothetical protein
MTSIAKETGLSPDLDLVSSHVARHFAAIFDLSVKEHSLIRAATA